MKVRIPSAVRGACLAVLGVFACCGIAHAQSVDCEGTLASWRLTHPEYARTCTCKGSGSMPVCGGQNAGSSGKGAGRTNAQQQMKLMVIESILNNVLAPQNHNAHEEELKRQQQEELARQQREEEERKRQEAFERSKDELLNAFKGGNSSTDLRLKGGGEELLDLKPASGAPQTGVAGRDRARRESIPPGR